MHHGRASCNAPHRCLIDYSTRPHFYPTLPSRSKKEVANLLETAGFSRANPYYVVQQGKIAQMANMKVGPGGVGQEAVVQSAFRRHGAAEKCQGGISSLLRAPASTQRRLRRVPAACRLQDEQRLELLKEIGGTRVYEDRRRESFRVMEECQAKRTHIQDLVGGCCWSSGGCGRG